MGGAQDAMRTAVRLQVDDASGSRVVEEAHHSEEDAATEDGKSIEMGEMDVLGMVPIGWGGETARQRVRLIGLIPSFFFGVSSRQPRFISVPSVSNPCWCGWVGFFSIFWIWRAEGRHVVGSPSCQNIDNINQQHDGVGHEGLVLSSQCMGYRWLTPRDRVFPQACTCVPSWDVNGRRETTKT